MYEKNIFQFAVYAMNTAEFSRTLCISYSMQWITTLQLDLGLYLALYRKVHNENQQHCDVKQ